jgi:hypothetical protein
LVEDPNLRPRNKNASGYTPGSTGVSVEMVNGVMQPIVLVRINPNAPHGGSVFTLAHELGHALDYSKGIGKKKQHFGTPCQYAYNAKLGRAIGRVCRRDDPREYSPSEDWADRIARFVTEGVLVNEGPFDAVYDR